VHCVLQMVEDRSLLAGYVSMFLSDFNAAQNLFLASSRPTVALEVILCEICTFLYVFSSPFVKYCALCGTTV